MRSGTAFTHLVELVGTPDGALTWALTDAGGTAVTNGTITPDVGAVSVLLTIPSINNTLGVGIRTGSRDLTWSYAVEGVIQSGSVQYLLEARIPFAVSPMGVRTKLGLGAVEDLGDDEIPLMKAYLVFEESVGSVELAAVTGDLAQLRVVDAIEAIAALSLLPSLQVRIAERESSGTNQYARGKIDWQQLQEDLQAMVQEGEAAANSALVAGSNGTSLLQLVTPDVDLFPGA